MSEVSSVSGSTPATGLQVSDTGQLTYDGSPTNILQAVMLVQLGFANEMQGIATDRASDAQDRLDEIKKVRSYISRMQTMKQNAAEDDDDDAAVMLYKDINDYMTSHGMEVNSVDDAGWSATEDDMKVNIQAMQSHLDNLTSQNDLEMVKLKNTLNQQGESLTAANKFATDSYNLAMGIINKG